MPIIPIVTLGAAPSKRTDVELPTVIERSSSPQPHATARRWIVIVRRTVPVSSDAPAASPRDPTARPTAIAAPRMSLRLFEGWGPRLAP